MRKLIAILAGATACGCVIAGVACLWYGRPVAAALLSIGACINLALLLALVLIEEDP
jgi:hypothetical protein